MRPPTENEGVGLPATARMNVVILAALCAAVIGLYILTVRDKPIVALGSVDPSRAYYNLLVDGFRSGHLYLKRDVPAGLAQLPNPWDPKANAAYRAAPKSLGALHDLSYYRGKLYLYFGVTPALLLFWPAVALFHHYLSHAEAVFIFVSGGLLAGAGLLRAIWRRYFAEGGVLPLFAGVAALGLATGIPIILQRPDVWEVPISCGYALIMLAFAALWRSLHERARKARWLALASLAFGLAVGARPSLLFGAVILLGPLAQAWMTSQAHGGRRWREMAPLAAAILVPLVAVGFGLALYNYLRFGSPAEFGQRYQMAGDAQTAKNFATGNVPFNFFSYFVALPEWSRHFPFVRSVQTQPLLPGHLPVEFSFGVLTGAPFVLLALGAPLAWRAAGDRPALKIFVLTVAVYFLTTAATLCFFYGNCVRYELDFAPPLMLLAAIGFMSLARASAGSSWPGIIRIGGCALLLYSIAFNLWYGARRNLEMKCEHGVSLFQDGFRKQGIAEIKACLRIDPDFADAHINLGTALAQSSDDPREALVEFATALRLKPKDAEAHNDLGTVLTQFPGHDRQALAEFQIAIRLKPDYAAAHSNLGCALSNIPGRRPEALTELRTALRLDPAMKAASTKLSQLLAER
jgi:tetratricopeptide (TPR) repeat protein